MEDWEGDWYRKRLERHRTWIYILCFICLMLAVACGTFYQKWREERTIRILSEALAESYQQDADHYQQLYYDCLEEDEPSYPWSGYSAK
jgi:hypothetical protein